MPKQYLIDPNLAFYKGNLHGHTILSDGKCTPEQYSQHYREQGYGIIAITDHQQYRYHSGLDTGNFVCLAGYEEEIHPKPTGDGHAGREKKTYHLNVYDLRPKTRPEGYIPPAAPDDYHNTGRINQWIALMRAEGFLVCYNHPIWSMQDYRDYSGLSGLWAMEIYNHGCEMDGMYGMAPQIYDEMLRSGQRLVCVGTDDNHNIYPFESKFTDSFGGFTMFNLPALSYENVAGAMERGNIYASMGPLFNEISLEDSILHISTSPVQSICVFTESRRCYIKFANPGSYLTCADFALNGAEDYLRVQIRDCAGKYAFSRAYFNDELFVR